MLISDWPDGLQFLAAMWLILLTLTVPLLVWYVWELRQGVAYLRGEFHRWTLDLVKKELGVDDRRAETERQLPRADRPVRPAVRQKILGESTEVYPRPADTVELAKQFKRAGAHLIAAGGDFDVVTDESGLNPRVYRTSESDDAGRTESEKHVPRATHWTDGISKDVAGRIPATSIGRGIRQTVAEDRDEGVAPEQHEEFLWLPTAWNGERHSQLSEIYLPTRHRKPVPRPEPRHDPEIGYPDGHDDTALWHIGPGRLYSDGELELGPTGVDPSGRGPYGSPGSAGDSRSNGVRASHDSDDTGDDSRNRPGDDSAGSTE